MRLRLCAKQHIRGELRGSRADNELRGSRADNELRGSRADNELRGSRADNELRGSRADNAGTAWKTKPYQLQLRMSTWRAAL